METIATDQDETQKLVTYIDHDSTFLYVIYLVYGIAMLLPWNAILTSMDYFVLKLPDF